MPAAGLFTSVKVEIQFIPGKWSDVSGDVGLETGVKITQGRADETTDIAPGTATFALRNDTGAYTPNNPLSAYFPYVTEGRAVRISVVRASVTYRRFTGFIQALEPVFPDNNSSTGEVHVTAIDSLATLSNRIPMTSNVEEAIRVARLQSTWVDVYTFAQRKRTSSRAPLYLTNYGITTTPSDNLGVATIQGSGHGYMAINASASGLIVDASIELNPRAKYAIGPIIKCSVGNATKGVAPSTQRVEFWMSVPQSFNYSGGNTYYVAHFWRTVGATSELFSLRLYQDSSLTVRFGIYDGSSAHILDFNDEDGNAATNLNDDIWHKVTVSYNGAGTDFTFDDSPAIVTSGALNLTLADRIYFGGGMKPTKEHGAFFCPPLQLAAITITGALTGVPASFTSGAPSTIDAQTRYYELLGYANNLIDQRLLTGVTYGSGSNALSTSTPQFSADDVGSGIGANTTALDWPPDTVVSAYVSPTQVTLSELSTAAGSLSLLIGPGQLGSDVRNVSRFNTADTPTMLDAFQILPRTWGSSIWTDPYGNPTLIHPDAINPASALVSLDLEADIEADGLQLRRAVDTVPTRVTVTGPIGDITFIDAATEAGAVTGQPYRNDLAYQAGCQNDSDAYSLGGFYATQSHGLRIVKVDVDLATAQTDLYATFLTARNLYPGQRLRGTNLPSTIFGATQTDVVVQGWEENYTADAAVFSFDLTPADDPVQGIWDDATNGRWSAGTSLQLGFPITSGGTAVVVAPADNTGVALTTTGGDYPLDLDILGERVTVASAPGTLNRTNLVTNPSFNTNTTGWSPTFTGSVACTLTRVQSPTIDDTNSMRITWPNAVAGNSGAQWTGSGLTIGHQYAFSAYLYVPNGNPRVKVDDIFGTMTGRAAAPISDTTGYNGAYVRIGFTGTATATSHFFGILTVDASTSGQIAYVDAVQLEDITGRSGGPGSYFDGDTAGGAWTGTAGASTSTQTTQTVTVTRGVAPTVARAHIAGELVDLYHSLTWTI